MALTINQFAQSTLQGELDLLIQSSVISARVSADQATALIAGQAVKLDSTKTGGVPAVLALAANTDQIYGYVVRNLKDASDPANATLELAQAGSVMYHTAGAAITRGAALEYVYSTNKFITWAGVNPIAGYAFDSASADGDVFRVSLITPASNPSSSALRSVDVTATLAEINAGKTLIPGVSGKQITVVGMTRRVTGAAAVATSADVQSSSGTKIMVDAIAGLTNGAVIINDGANSTPGAGWAVPLTAGDGVVVANVGSAMTTLTSIRYNITYKIQ